MLMVVRFAFSCAFLTDPGAQFQGLAKDLFVAASTAHRQLASRFAHVGAIKTGPDTLAHVRRFCGARIRAAKTHPRAVHEMMSRIPERLIDMPGDFGVQCDHLANGHW